MQSKTNKLRGQLANVAQEREQFEKQMKDLEAQMYKGKSNMDKINKGLKGHEISGALSELDLDQGPSSPKLKTKSGSTAGRINRGVSGKSQGDFTSHNLNLSPNKSFYQGGTSRSLSNTGSSGIDSHSSSLSSTAKFSSMNMRQTVIMPTFSRVSDWCFTGPLDSSPPTVKTNDVYEFVRWLGRGSFGDVQLAKSVEEKQLYAMKTIFSEHQSEMQKSLNEVVILRTYRHPYIIDILDSYCTMQPKILHIVMHYCEGGDLGKSIIAAKKSSVSISEHLIIKWSIQLALALHFLHENHVLHRDLKPSNALLTDGGETVKLADFGLTVELDNNVCETGAEAGTPLYTAPEMINGEKYSYPTDCWSFGVMLHELLSLDPPFYKGDTTDLVKSILNEEPPELPSHYSQELRLFCKLFLVKNPNHRLGFAAMLCDPFLASKVQSFPSSYRPKSLEERIRRAHVKQLQIQIEALHHSTLSSSIPVSDLLELIEREKEEKALAETLAAESLSQGQLEGENEDYSKSSRNLNGAGGLLRKPSMRKTSLEKKDTMSQSASNLKATLDQAQGSDGSPLKLGGATGLQDLCNSLIEVQDDEEEEEREKAVTEGQDLAIIDDISDPSKEVAASDIPLDSSAASQGEDLIGETPTIETIDAAISQTTMTSDPTQDESIHRQISGGRIGQALAEALLIDHQVNETATIPENADESVPKE